MINVRATLAQLGWLAASVPAHRRFLRALREPRRAQTDWLARHLARHHTCAYARIHGLTPGMSYDAFARACPITSYDNLAPWIERLRAGESAVLSTDPATRLVPTSGTSGARKLIPFTRTLQREFNAAIGPWLVDLCTAYPSMVFGPAYWSVTPMGEVTETEHSVVPVGFGDDSEYLGGVRAWLVEGAMAVPSQVRLITDLPAFRRTVLLHLLARRDLRFISVWHPSFLSLLLDTLRNDWSSLLTELAGGRSAKRVRKLSVVDPTDITSIWPDLHVVSCWGDAHATGPTADLQRRMPGVRIQPKGLLATEAFVTVPFQNAHPVAIASHFFEFIDDAGNVHRVEDLRVGSRYEVIVTTGGGLWRYRLGDQVEVTGFVEQTPSLRFLGRGGNVSDRCGEKLAEAYVGSVLAALCPQASFAMLAPEREQEAWHYALFLEQETPAPRPEELDDALRTNPHYALCRRLGQLGSPRIVPVRNAYARFTAAERARGMRLGDIKPVVLSQRDDWSRHFEASEVLK